MDKKLTKSQNAIVVAHNKGYRVSKEGIPYNPEGVELCKKVKRSIRISFSIKINGEYVGVLVHRLQAYQKFGMKMFEDGIEVRHLDNNCKNNAWDNLELGNHAENMADSTHYRTSYAKVTEEQVREIRARYAKGETAINLAKEFGYKSANSIHDMVTRKTWGWVK